MKLLQLVTAAFLPFTALAAKKSPGERFDAASSKSQPVKLDDQSFDALTKAPRDYSVAVLLTALDSRFACALCTEFQPEWELLAKSWTKGDKNKESRLVFGTLDFLDGKATFQAVWQNHRSLKGGGNYAET
jgi:oligosaccharyltransferase complex subunit gamma